MSVTIPSQRGASLPNLWVSLPFMCTLPLTQKDQVRRGGTCFGGQPHASYPKWVGPMQRYPFLRFQSVYTLRNRTTKFGMVSW